jgi:hypothetical protein
VPTGIAGRIRAINAVGTGERSAVKINEPGNHIDQLLRQTRWHHVQLSAMADAKANMMLTVPAVLNTLAVPRLTEPQFRWAAVVLIVFCLITIVLAACAAMPGKTAAADAPGNLLFFNDFAHMSYEQYEEAMEKTLNDPTRTYQAQVREIYTLGIYLATKKYRYVRLAYLSFVGGLLVSSAVFMAIGLMGEG